MTQARTCSPYRSCGTPTTRPDSTSTGASRSGHAATARSGLAPMVSPRSGSEPVPCAYERSGHGQLTSRPRPAQYGSRSLNFWILPVAVRGIASRNSTDVGAL